MEELSYHSPLFLTGSAFGLVVMASTILGDFELTNMAKVALRLTGAAMIAAGLAFA